MNDDKITSSEMMEGQLSITFDDLSLKNGIMRTKDFLAAKAEENRDRKPETNKSSAPAESSADIDKSKDTAAKTGNPQKSGETSKARPHLPQNPIKLKDESEQPEPPPKPLSDMEVMEHTASVWQYKEITDDGTEMHSEYHEKSADAGFAKILGARVRGKKHKHEGTNCDDFFETAHTGDCAIAVVCDGAGSKPLSRIGSRVSSEAAANYLKRTLTRLFAENPSLKAGLSAELNSAEFMTACGKIAPLVQQSAREAFAAQKKALDELLTGDDKEKYRKAVGRDPVLSDLYTTFLAAAIVPLEINGKRECFMACVQIGDGCICAVDSEADAEHCLKIMGEADSGAFSGETDFLSEKNTRSEAIGAKTRISRGSSDRILLMSDGVADDYFPAAPMMKRLYLDLCLNGILPMKGELTGGEDPAPIRFRSVSLSQTSVALQYAKQLLADKSDEAINALWDKREMLRCHSLEAFRMNIGDTPEERLRVWLDNYNERGSFDDRTLVVVSL
ncbi:MAG: protein phosphatase 2C domain-containing protein [Oscillospiraceae bacterium]|nr:protein phosphatase 2C domain-containing protein [Oscillospiraceae bacterium]